MSLIKLTAIVVITTLLLTTNAQAHDPIFGLGPHVLFKEGIEIQAGIAQQKKGDNKDTEQVIDLKYGLTGDWVAGIELPYQQQQNPQTKKSGFGDITLSTKYRFWRLDALAEQNSAAVLLKVKLNSSDDVVTSDTVDTLVGLSYGYESIKWYRWASIRYRFNEDNKQGGNTLERGNRTFVDVVLGYRPTLNGYREPDMVYMVELNGEFAQRNNFNGVAIKNTGGDQWFISPGFMWTLRNMAIKGGVQLPIYAHLTGDQAESDYRFKLSIEWHL